MEADPGLGCPQETAAFSPEPPEQPSTPPKASTESPVCDYEVSSKLNPKNSCRVQRHRQHPVSTGNLSSPPACAQRTVNLYGYRKEE